jgi:hypothetical protein
MVPRLSVALYLTAKTSSNFIAFFLILNFEGFTNPNKSQLPKFQIPNLFWSLVIEV